MILHLALKVSQHSKLSLSVCLFKSPNCRAVRAHVYSSGVSQTRCLHCAWCNMVLQGIDAADEVIGVAKDWLLNFHSKYISSHNL